jgi:hypothetical protein
VRLHLRDDGLLHLPAEAIKASTVAFLRIWLGLLWLIEVTIGPNWKLGSLSSGTNPAWFGAGAGDAVREQGSAAIADGTYAGYAWVLERLVIPNAEVVGYLVVGLQVALGLAFLIGFAVRPMAVVALGLDLSILLLGHAAIPPLFTAMHLFVLVTNAGIYYGLDGWLLVRCRWTNRKLPRALVWLIELPVFSRRHLVPAMAITGLAGVVVLLTAVNRSTERFTMVAVSLAIVLGLIAVGLYATSRYGDGFTAAAATLRIFVGILFLHEIFARTAPGIDALPGFATAEAQSVVFQQVAANHWSVFAVFTHAIGLPTLSFWVVILGAVQFVAGVLLLVGYRTRGAGMLGLAYLGVLICFGFTRFAPIVLGLLIVAIALDGGRILSLDSLRRPGLEARFGLPIPPPLIPALLVLAAVNAVAAGVTAVNLGIAPDAYVDSMAAMVTLFVALISGSLAFIGWLQRHPALDHSGDVLHIGRRNELVEPLLDSE